ncbi:MAG: NupC/NupG family nucleoside CNT transporter [Myxococcales bacterium]|nr:NupC/NupG family nucleoside CNT transporter [Myxococcales bacterium]
MRGVSLFASVVNEPVGIGYRALSLLGIAVMVGLAWLISFDRKGISWRPVLWGIGLQVVLAAVVLTPAAQAVFFDSIDAGVHRLLSFSEAGSTFVFQSIEPHRVLEPSGEKTDVIAGQVSPPVKTFAFWVLPTIVFFSSLMSVLYHAGVMQRVVYGLAWIMQRTARISGAESLSTAANIFLGQTEAPLTVRPYVATMTNSELFLVMVGGFATVAGGVMAAYVSFLKDIPGIAGHLVTASIIGAPASIAVSKIMLPEREVPHTQGKLDFEVKRIHGNVLEAAADGASEGMKLFLNVVAMLLAFVALVAMADYFLSLIPLAGEPLSMARIMGWLFSPIAFAMGIPWNEAQIVGRLLGEKLVLTEFIAYIHLGQVVQSPTIAISHRSAIIASYALCGFANFASIGIQLGGIGAMAPDRMKDLSRIAFRAMLAGAIANCMMGNVVGLFL